MARPLDGCDQGYRACGRTREVEPSLDCPGSHVVFRSIAEPPGPDERADGNAGVMKKLPAGQHRCCSVPTRLRSTRTCSRAYENSVTVRSQTPGRQGDNRGMSRQVRPAQRYGSVGGYPLEMRGSTAHASTQAECPVEGDACLHLRA